MGKVFSAHTLIISIILSLYTVCSSGISVGFLYDARSNSGNQWSPQGTLTFLERNKVRPSQFKVLIPNLPTYLDTMLNTTGSISADLYLSQIEAQKLIKEKSSAASLIESYLTSTRPSFSIGSIVVSSEKLGISSLLPTLKSIETLMNNLKLSRRVKVSTVLPLSIIKSMGNSQLRLLEKVMQFLVKRKAYVTIEIVIYGKLSMGDAFVHSVVEKALSACNALPYLNIPLVLHVKSSVAPSGVEIAEFTAKAIKSITSHNLLRKRILGLFVDISHLSVEQEKLGLEEEMLFPSAHRELLNHGSETNPITRPRVHDSLTPVTIPATTPITVPSTIPPPTVITIPSTIPSTNPVTVYPTNPTITPVTPITDPATDPTQTPTSTTPVVPVTNPTTTPTTIFPVSPALANPITTYPVTPTGTTPYVAPTVTVPSTTPATPSVGGQAYCVAKTGLPDQSLQSALDYACGIGNVDCSALQPTGSCYNPNTLQDHASYAFNSYYQKNPVSTSCDFGGTAMLVNANPSSLSCVYLSSSSVSTSTPASVYNPASTNIPITGATTSPSVPVLNSNNPVGPDTEAASYSPTGSINSGVILSAGWIVCVFVLTIVFLKVNM